MTLFPANGIDCAAEHVNPTDPTSALATRCTTRPMDRKTAPKTVEVATASRLTIFRNRTSIEFRNDGYCEYPSKKLQLTESGKEQGPKLECALAGMFELRGLKSEREAEAREKRRKELEAAEQARRAKVSKGGVPVTRRIEEPAEELAPSPSMPAAEYLAAIREEVQEREAQMKRLAEQGFEQIPSFGERRRHLMGDREG